MASKGETSKVRILETAKALVMRNGFAGTAIDDILREASISKGAFFHHFPSKNALALELMRWHAAQDLKMFRTLAAEAEARFEDPYEQTIHYLEAFEEYISDADRPSRGCMYAVYTYESDEFDAEINDLVSDTLQGWTAIYIRKFQEILDLYQPAEPVTARQLAELIVSVIEGGLVLQRAFGRVDLTARQSAHFRLYLDLLFRDSIAARRAAPA